MKKLNYAVTLASLALFISAPAAAQDKYMGEIFWLPTSWCPNGSLPANGQSLAVSQYQALYSLLGTTYGGTSQQTSFNLPDLRGRVSIVYGYGTGSQPYSLGQKGGAEVVTLNQTQLPAATVVSNSTVTVVKAPTDADPQSTAKVVGPLSTGGNQPIENRTPYLALNACILVDGIYPSRP